MGVGTVQPSLPPPRCASVVCGVGGTGTQAQCARQHAAPTPPPPPTPGPHRAAHTHVKRGSSAWFAGSFSSFLTALVSPFCVAWARGWASIIFSGLRHTATCAVQCYPQWRFMYSSWLRELPHTHFRPVRAQPAEHAAPYPARPLSKQGNEDLVEAVHQSTGPPPAMRAAVLPWDYLTRPLDHLAMRAAVLPYSRVT